MKHFFQEWNESIIVINEYNLNFPLHLHKTVELILVIEGQVVMHLGNQKYILNSGDIATIFPGQLHSYESTHENTTLCIIIFHPFILNNFTNEFELFHPEQPILRSDCYDNDIYLAFERLRKEENKQNTRVMAAWIQLIMAHAIPEYNMLRNLDNGEPNLLYKIIDFLSAHYTEHLTLDVLAKELHINKYYLSHTFSSKLYMSFTDYLNRLRTDHAIMLLSSTNCSITDIGEKTGFETQRTFNRVFKKTTGLTPSEYRANM